MATETPPRQADLGHARRGFGSSSRRRWVPAFLVVGLVLLVLLAIVAWPDGGKPAARPDPDPTTEKQAIVEAIRGFDRTRDEANSPPNPAHPGFVTFSTGHARDIAVKATQENRQKGIVVRLLPNSQARANDEVVSIDGGNAIVRECRVDDGLLVEQATGRVVNDDVVTRLITIILVREEGRWKVASTQVEQKWEGVAGCAA